MAIEHKKGKKFVVFEAQWRSMSEYTVEEVGQFFSAMCAYMFDDAEPDFQDRALRSNWQTVKGQLDGGAEVAERMERVRSTRHNSVQNSVQTSKQGSKQNSVQTSKQGSKQNSVQTSKQGSKQNSLQTSKQGSKQNSVQNSRQRSNKQTNRTELNKQNSSVLVGEGAPLPGGARPPLRDSEQPERTLGPDGRWYIGHQCVGPFDEDAEGGGLDAEPSAG